MFVYLKKVVVTQRYCPLCLRDDVEVKYDPSSMKVEDSVVLYFSPTIICPDCGQHSAFEWASFSCEVYDYARMMNERLISV